MEVWKDIPGYKDLYQISSHGRVKSLKRKSTNRYGPKFINERILKSSNKDEYLQVDLCIKGKRSKHKIHKLVAISFLNHSPCGHKIVIDHIDNNKHNNHFSNLQLITNRLNSIKDRPAGKYSKYVGVTFCTNLFKWKSSINILGVNIYLGYFLNEEKASLTYNVACLNKDKFNGDKLEFRLLVSKKVTLMVYTEQQNLPL